MDVLTGQAILGVTAAFGGRPSEAAGFHCGDLASCGGPAQSYDDLERLEEDGLAHLRCAFAALLESDRHLDDAGAEAVGAESRLDLEGVTAGMDRVEIDGLEDIGPPCLEAAGQVAVRQTEHDPREDPAAQTDDAPHGTPARDGTALHVSAAEHEVGATFANRIQHGLQEAHWVAEVRVHLDYDVGPAGGC